MSSTASYEQQVAAYLAAYREKFPTAVAARAARDLVLSAVEGQTVDFIGQNFEGGGSTAIVVRDKFATLEALNQLISELDPTVVRNAGSRPLMTFPEHSFFPARA